jgi:hypothetical protein
LLHDVKFGGILKEFGHGKANPIRRNTGTNLELMIKACWKSQLYGPQSSLILDFFDSGDALYDSCEHIL